jgi:hypothetical protein
MGTLLVLPNYSWRTVPQYETFAMNFFVSMKYRFNASAAICGNIMQESGFNPNAIRKNDAGPGEDSLGICQWNKERKLNMLSHVLGTVNVSYTEMTDHEKFSGQLAFIIQELTTDYAHARLILETGTSDPNLANSFGVAYEGFSDKSNSKRVAYAQQILARYKGVTKLSYLPWALSSLRTFLFG